MPISFGVFGFLRPGRPLFPASRWAIVEVVAWLGDAICVSGFEFVDAKHAGGTCAAFVPVPKHQTLRVKRHKYTLVSTETRNVTRATRNASVVRRMLRYTNGQAKRMRTTRKHTKTRMNPIYPGCDAQHIRIFCMGRWWTSTFVLEHIIFCWGMQRQFFRFGCLQQWCSFFGVYKQLNVTFDTTLEEQLKELVTSAISNNLSDAASCCARSFLSTSFYTTPTELVRPKTRSWNAKGLQSWANCVALHFFLIFFSWKNHFFCAGGADQCSTSSLHPFQCCNKWCLLVGSLWSWQLRSSLSTCAWGHMGMPGGASNMAAGGLTAPKMRISCVYCCVYVVFVSTVSLRNCHLFFLFLSCFCVFLFAFLSFLTSIELLLCFSFVPGHDGKISSNGNAMDMKHAARVPWTPNSTSYKRGCHQIQFNLE